MLKSAALSCLISAAALASPTDDAHLLPALRSEGFIPATPSANAGILPEPSQCVIDPSCAQPGDFNTFINASFFDAAEVMEFAQDSALTQICATFVFAGGSCPNDPMATEYNQHWTWSLFTVDAQGVPAPAATATFDTEFPLANLTVENFFTGTIGAGFPVFDFIFTLGNENGGMASPLGFQVNAGDCAAIQPKFNLAGCSSFWETSSNEDDSLTGDGLSLQDAMMDGYDSCDYTTNDLLLCLDVLTTQPPSCTSGISLEPPANDECENASPLVCDARTTQCILFSSESASDPAIACALDEPSGYTGFATTWFTFTPTGPRAIISMCSFPPGTSFPANDAVLAVYTIAETPGAGVGPCELIQIACSDDACFGNQPFLCLNDLTPNETYTIELVAKTLEDAAQHSITLTCNQQSIPAPPSNDECADAEELEFSFPAGPGIFGALQAFGSTSCGAPDPIAPNCFESVHGDAPGVWFTVVGDGYVWDICTGDCNDFDSLGDLSIFCGDCETGFTCLANATRIGLGGPDSYIRDFCTEAGRRYYFYMEGTGALDLAGFEIHSNIDLSESPCVMPIDPCALTPCVGDCDGTGTVDFNDLLEILFSFGGTGVPANCDADNSGAIDFNDLVAALFAFGPCP